jgi:hypothetical protein
LPRWLKAEAEQHIFLLQHLIITLGFFPSYISSSGVFNLQEIFSAYC